MPSAAGRGGFQNVGDGVQEVARAKPRLLGAGFGRRFDLEAVRGRVPGDAGAELARRRLERPRQLHDRAQARLSAGSLEQRDLGAMEIAAVAQLFLGDARDGASVAEVCGEPLLRTQVTNSS